MDKTSFNVKIFDWDYLHLTAQTKETYFSLTLADAKAIVACTSDILRYFFRSCLRSKIYFGRQEFLFSVVKKLQRLPDVQSIRNLTLCNKRGRGPTNNAESGAKIDTS